MVMPLSSVSIIALNVLGLAGIIVWHLQGRGRPNGRLIVQIIFFTAMTATLPAADIAPFRYERTGQDAIMPFLVDCGKVLWWTSPCLGGHWLHAHLYRAGQTAEGGAPHPGSAGGGRLSRHGPVDHGLRLRRSDRYASRHIGRRRDHSRSCLAKYAVRRLFRHRANDWPSLCARRLDIAGGRHGRQGRCQRLAGDQYPHVGQQSHRASKQCSRKTGPDELQPPDGNASDEAADEDRADAATGHIHGSFAARSRKLLLDFRRCRRPCP